MSDRRFTPIATLEELDALDEGEMVDGYLSAQRGDPEPGENRGKAFWHGWRCRMMDYGEIPVDSTHTDLVRAYVARGKTR